MHDNATAIRSVTHPWLPDESIFKIPAEARLCQKNFVLDCTIAAMMQSQLGLVRGGAVVVKNGHRRVG